MDELDRELLASHPIWQQVLQMYLDLTEELSERPQVQAGPRWAPRIDALDELEPGELSVIHGQLIALGWLRFQFEAEQTGLMYRISTEGRTLLSRVQGKPVMLPPEAAFEADAEEATETDRAAA